MPKMRTSSPILSPLVARLARIVRGSLGSFALVGLLAAGSGGCASYIDRAREAKDNRDYIKAEQYYRLSQEKDRDPVDRELALAELVTLKVELAQATAKSDPTKAEQLYREALEIDPRDEKAQDGLSRVLASIGRIDEAIAIAGGEAGFGKCDLCERYLAVLLKQRAKNLEQEKKLEGALADFKRSFELLADPATAFAIARVLKGLDRQLEAAKALEEAIPTIRPEDRQAQADFVKIREEAVLQASSAGDLELADRYLSMFPPGSGGDPWYTLQFRVASDLWARAETDRGIARLEPLLGEDHRETLSDRIRQDMVRLLERLYIRRGTGYLREGAVDEADRDFARASELVPDNDTIKLLRILAIAGSDLARARTVIEAMPPETKGHSEVTAILESMLVFERLDVGDLTGAKEALARAQAASPDTPEVHVAMAAILAVTPFDGLSRRDVKTLQRLSLANYRDGIFRYGEALSEIAWAREQAKNLGVSYEFRVPGGDATFDRLERRIREPYPFGVAFNADPTTLLKLRTKGPELEVKITGPGVEESVNVSSSGSPVIKLEEPGLVVISYGRQQVAILAESYTAVEVDLP